MASGKRLDSWTQGRSQDILRDRQDSSEWASCALTVGRVSSDGHKNPHHPNDVKA